jgi:hypothetical protein
METHELVSKMFIKLSQAGIRDSTPIIGGCLPNVNTGIGVLAIC